MRRRALILGACLATLVAAPILAAPPAKGRVATLAERLRFDTSFKVRMLAAKKLGALANGPERRAPAALAALRLGLEDPSGIVRSMCARSLVAHRDRGALPALAQLADYDPDRAVRREARRAHDKLQKMQAPLRIALGSVSLVGTQHDRGASRAALESRLSDAIEDQLLPHRPAIFPREAAQLRMDVEVLRRPSPRPEIRYEVRVVLLELPKSHLRHTAMAVARAPTRGAEGGHLEERVALEAVARAVEDVLATAVGSE